MRNLTQAEARSRAELVTVTTYDVDLDVTLGPETFLSSTVVRFTSLPGDSFLELDAPELLAATLDGRPLALAGNRIALDGLGGEHEVRVTARCSYTRSGEGLHRFVDPVDGRVYIYLQAFLDDAQRVFACFDQPDLKAVHRLRVRADSGDVVRSNRRGRLLEGVHVFEPTARISTYLLTLAAGPWHSAQEQYGDLELGLWCRQSMAAHLEPQELFDITRRSLAYQQELFGSPFPFGDKYDQVFCPEFNFGAMENPGMVTFSDESLLFRSRTTAGTRRGRATTIAHEMAHMWFGDLVTMRWWDGIWLNESFAELLGMQTVDAVTDWDGTWSAFCLGRKAAGYRADQLPTTHPIDAQVPDSRAALHNFDGISYEKGASALRQLSAFVGEDVFYIGLRAYLDEHAYGNTDLQDLLRALEIASGRDLQGWAQTWLRRTGVNTLRPIWDGDRLTVEQRGEVLRDHVVRLGAYDAADGVLVRRESRRVELSGAQTRVADFAPADLVIVNDGDLTFAKIRFDDRSLATVVNDLAAVPDPLARAVCWSALWDATRDAELPARDFVTAVVQGVAVEGDSSVVETLLGQAVHAATSYASVGEQAGLLDRLARDCSDAEVEPGGDLQLVRLRTAVTASSDGVWLARLLAGEVPDGVVLDAGLRWHVVRRAAVLGLLDEQDLAAELSRDRTAGGELQAAAARAARPDPDSKARTWAALAASDVSTAELRAAGSAFWQHGQDELLRPYADAYLATLPRWWAGSSAQLSRTATLVLFPRTLVDAEVLAQVDELLRQDDLPAGLRRGVLEGVDDLARCLRAQAAAG